MDDLVKQALAKWPDVPDCTGWLALDARGRWRIGEAKAGARKPITHGAMIAFINRNYIAADRCWYFQNGPQRVFVELEYTPFVWRLVPRDDAWDLVSHTGVPAVPIGVWLDDAGRFLIEAKSNAGERWIGVLHDHDTALLADLLRDGDGDALDDEAINGLTASTVEVATRTAPKTCAQLHWIAAKDARPLSLPLQRIATEQVPARFEFEPRPSIVVPADLDTRR